MSTCYQALKHEPWETYRADPSPKPLNYRGARPRRPPIMFGCILQRDCQRVLPQYGYVAWRSAESRSVINLISIKWSTLSLRGWVNRGVQINLSWEKNHPERAIWTAHIVSELQLHLANLNNAYDVGTFAPRYTSLTDDQKLAVWGELICGVALFESSWNPCARSAETTLGNDSVTGEPVFSEGLLQLSYQDVLNYPHLTIPFDWNSDQRLARTDCSKSILDPLKNLTAGTSILAEQVRGRRGIVLRDPYWSTLGDPAHWRQSKVSDIAEMIRQQFPFVV